MAGEICTCGTGPAICRILRLQGEDCCPDCIHPRNDPATKAGQDTTKEKQ